MQLNADNITSHHSWMIEMLCKLSCSHKHPDKHLIKNVIDDYIVVWECSVMEAEGIYSSNTWRSVEMLQKGFLEISVTLQKVISSPQKKTFVSRFCCVLNDPRARRLKELRLKRAGAKSVATYPSRPRSVTTLPREIICCVSDGPAVRPQAEGH